MKATELMIGDWVYDKVLKSNARVEALQPLTIKCDIHTQKHICDEFEPVKLTPGILEKNGFKDAPAKDTDAHNLVGKWWHKSGDVYVKKYCLSHGTYAYTIGSHPYTRIENIHNVHELQRALRCCVLWDLADNFQV